MTKELVEAVRTTARWRACHVVDDAGRELRRFTERLVLLGDGRQCWEPTEPTFVRIHHGQLVELVEKGTG